MTLQSDRIPGVLYLVQKLHEINGLSSAHQIAAKVDALNQEQGERDNVRDYSSGCP